MLARLMLALILTQPGTAQTLATVIQASGGKPLSALAPPRTRAVVLFFVASDCPISNRTFPEMLHLRHRFAAQNVRVWFVYPNPTESAAAVQSHQAAFDPGGEALLDPRGTLVAITAALVTPEAAILIPRPGAPSGWQPVYLGRIDDRFESIGHERPQPTRHFAEQALRAVLDGTPIEQDTGHPVGCAIVSPARLPR